MTQCYVTAVGNLDNHGTKGVKLGRMLIVFGLIHCMEVPMNVELRSEWGVAGYVVLVGRLSRRSI